MRREAGRRRIPARPVRPVCLSAPGPAAGDASASAERTEEGKPDRWLLVEVAAALSGRPERRCAFSTSRFILSAAVDEGLLTTYRRGTERLIDRRVRYRNARLRLTKCSPKRASHRILVHIRQNCPELNPTGDAHSLPDRGNRHCPRSKVHLFSAHGETR